MLTSLTITLSGIYFLFLFYSWENWDTGRMNNLPCLLMLPDAKLVSSAVMLYAYALYLKSVKKWTSRWSLLIPRWWRNMAIGLSLWFCCSSAALHSFNVLGTTWLSTRRFGKLCSPFPISLWVPFSAPKWQCNQVKTLLNAGMVNWKIKCCSSLLSTGRKGIVESLREFG